MEWYADNPPSCLIALVGPYWTKDILCKIASFVGYPLATDVLTSTRGPLSYARVLVEVKIGYDLPSAVPEYGEFLQPIFDEWKPTKCESCAKIGHLAKDCQKVVVKENAPNREMTVEPVVDVPKACSPIGDVPASSNPVVDQVVQTKSATVGEEAGKVSNELPATELKETAGIERKGGKSSTASLPTKAASGGEQTASGSSTDLAEVSKDVGASVCMEGSPSSDAETAIVLDKPLHSFP